MCIRCSQCQCQLIRQYDIEDHYEYIKCNFYKKQVSIIFELFDLQEDINCIFCQHCVTVESLIKKLGFGELKAKTKIKLPHKIHFQEAQNVIPVPYYAYPWYFFRPRAALYKLVIALRIIRQHYPDYKLVSKYYNCGCAECPKKGTCTDMQDAKDVYMDQNIILLDKDGNQRYIPPEQIHMQFINV